MKILKSIAYAVGLPIILIIIWWAATLGTANFYAPSPALLVETFAQVWFSELFLTDVLPSIGRMLAGIALAIVIGTTAGLAIGTTRWLRVLLEPTLEFLRAVPPPVLIPVMMLIMGISDSMKIVTIVFGCVWPVLLNTVEGVRAVDSVLSDSSRSYAIGGLARVRHLLIPSASPQIMVGVRQSLSLGLILMVISEMFASSSGLGFSIIKFQRSFAIPEMWSGIALLGLIGVGLSFLFQFVERKALRWYHGQKEVEHAS